MTVSHIDTGLIEVHGRKPRPDNAGFAIAFVSRSHWLDTTSIRHLNLKPLLYVPNYPLGTDALHVDYYSVRYTVCQHQGKSHD